MSATRIPSLPRVGAPAGWRWYHFRIRYLPTVVSGLAVITAVWLWALNLPETAGVAPGRSATALVDRIKDIEHQAAVPAIPDAPPVVKNGNIRLTGGL